MARARPSVRFQLDGGIWVEERESVGFTGETDFGLVEFLVTNEVLAQLLDPDFDVLDRDTALETFVEFESDIHRIALREFVKRLGGEPPILITAADFEG